jgi:alkylation response protein AidB-like acyl-CoA dehydrogenase
MNLLLSDEQNQIVDTLRHFLSEQAGVARFRPPAPQFGNRDLALLPALAEFGVLGIALPEDAGGTGLGDAEEAIVFREFGRNLLSPALFGHVLAAHVAHACGEREILAALLDGSTRVGLMTPRDPLCDPRGAGSGASVRGACHLIEGRDADWIFACDEHGAALYARNDFADVEPVDAMDHALTLDRARCSDVQPAASLSSADAPIHARALVLAAAYGAGIAEATLQMAVDYAKVREQFGKPIGSFQAVKHICAEMAMRAEAANSQVSFASLSLAGSKDAAIFHSTASKLVATDAALRNAQQNIQVHGAIGFTAEADAHVFLKRAHVVEQLWGDTRTQRQRMLDATFPG